jgi:hypothetical protein
MVMEGEITAEEAETHPQRSILTRALGVDQTIQVDEGDIEVVSGDRLLLCTDGLTGMVPEGQIREILLETPDPQEAVEKLVKVANRAGGIDNITAVILDFVDDGGRPGRDEGVRDPPSSPRWSNRSRRRLPPTAPTSRSSARRSRRRSPRRGRHRRRAADRRIARSGLTPEPGPQGGRPSSRRVGQEGGDLDGRDARDRRALPGGPPPLPRQPVVRGVSNGRVAIFRGVPAEVGGFELHSVVVETSIPAERAESIGFYRALPTASRRTTEPVRRPSWRASARTSPGSSSPPRESRGRRRRAARRSRLRSRSRSWR